jgi:hypothetical protein
MSNELIRIADDFWNIRGSFRVGGLIDVGTQVSLVRLANERFVFLDSYSLSRAARREVDEITNGGECIDAILNLHPFHTLHVSKMHELYPQARLYGTTRHISRFPDLPWESLLTEDGGLHELFEEDFEFSVPAGVDFVSANENVHFSSVLALHTASGTIHADDTFMYIKMPILMRFFGLNDSTSFHLTLARALQKRAGAAVEFQQWADQLIERWKDAQNLCAAHTTNLLASENNGASIHDRLVKALDKVSSTLEAHEQKYG